ncbi:MAG: transposase, partial [Alphaproteobacteria bacterium]|nr:transposase [Alphaproteobacteria bacterium]
MADHDSLYHRLFSHPGMIAQLLRDFVDEPWIGDLDF